MEKQDILTQFGLSKEESAIYVAALELGESLPSHLAQKASIKRPMLYKIMPELFSKGLLSQTVKGKRRYIVAEEPHLLLEKKQAELKMLEEKNIFWEKDIPIYIKHGIYCKKILVEKEIGENKVLRSIYICKQFKINFSENNRRKYSCGKYFSPFFSASFHIFKRCGSIMRTLSSSGKNVSVILRKPASRNSASCFGVSSV